MAAETQARGRRKQATHQRQMVSQAARTVQVMSSYIGRHAELYDVFYADKPYEAEAVFVHQLIQQNSLTGSRSLLELACGTGSHAFVLERLGYQIEAIDYSADMIAVAQRKAE